MTSPDLTTAPAFARADRRKNGYDAQLVDEFLARAREAFESGSGVTSQEIRQVSFPLVRGGYQIPSVDAALARIEDVFAARERERALSQLGARAWVRSSRTLAQEVLDRLTRPPRARFERVGFTRYGYRIDEVDLVADKLAGYLESGDSIAVDQVRSVAFRMQRGGYREDQVDAVLDAIIDVMLAVG